jgi:cell wall-associated NlpC family hydrolase
MKLLVDYALRFVGVPYIWGGNNYLTGLDCSGFVQELLAMMGVDPPGDQTAQGLHNWLAQQTISLKIPQVGALVFFGNSPQSVTHVAMALDYYRMIEAGGGGSKTVDRETAAQQGAVVRIRPIDRRKDLVGIYMPKYRP